MANFISKCGSMLLMTLAFPVIGICQETNSRQKRMITFSGNETDKAILDGLILHNKYDHRHRPSNCTEVNAAIQLFSVASPDESSLNYEVEFLLTLTWVDQRLEFNDGDRHPYLKALNHAKLIWVPDIYFINHGELKDPLVDMSLKVFSNGTVHHITKRSMVINCQGNLQIFPFDNPKCPFAFESISHEQTEVKLQWSTIQQPNLRQASSFYYHNAYMVKHETGECDDRHSWRGNFSCLRVLLVFTRDKSFYFSTVFGPGMLLVTSSFISFWLDINVVPARVMIGVTTMLNFCTTTNNFRSKLPVVSNLTAMNLWDGVCMFFIYASLLEFVIGNYIERQYPHIKHTETEVRRLPPTTKGRKRPPYMDGDAMSLQPMVQRNTSSDPVAVPGPEFNVEDVGASPVAPESSPQEAKEEEATRPQETAAQQMSRRPSAHTPTTPTGPFVDCIVVLRHKAKSLDDMAKLVFPVIFGIFISCFFLTYAVIKPRQAENWELVGSQ